MQAKKQKKHTTPRRQMKKLFFLFLAIQSSLLALDPYDNKKVGKLEIIVESDNPHASYDTTSLLHQLKTRVGEAFSQTDFDSDLKLLSEQFDRTEPRVSQIDHELHILIMAWPKPLISKIEWKGVKHVSERSLDKELGIEKNTLFDRGKFNQGLNKVKDFYYKKGYFQAEVTYTTQKVEKLDAITITITVNEGRSGHVNKIIFTGFTPDEKKEIQQMMLTKKHNVLLSWLTGQGKYRDEVIEHDQMTILNYLQNRGYADAQVKIVLPKEKDNKLAIEIIAHRGPVYHFGKVTYEGNTLFTDQEITKKLLIHDGALYSPDQMRDTAQAIKDLYGQKGHIDTQVTFEAYLRDQSPIYDVHYQIEEGQEYKIGMIRIFGNKQTESHVILRESLLIPGEVFDSRKLKATQSRLENIGYFKSVNVYSVRSEEDAALGPNYRDVYIEVKEDSTGSVNLFLGASSKNDVYGGLELTERNFNHRGFPHFSKLRGGGEYFHIKGTLGAKQQSVLVSWMDPYFQDSLWRLGVEGSWTNSWLQSDDYSIKTYGASIFTSYPISPYFTFGSKFRSRYGDVDTDKDLGIDGKRIEKRSDGWILAVGPSLSFDNTDNAFKAHRGLRSNLDAELASAVNHGTHFAKSNFVNALYIPVHRKTTLKTRLDFHYIFPLNTGSNKIPLQERYFLGGEDTVRGYKPYILGKHFRKDVDHHGSKKHHGKETDDPMGGVSAFLFSLELSQSLLPVFDIFTFFDAGSVTLHTFAMSQLNMSIGVGARLELMHKLPFMAGIGYPMNAERHKDKRNFFFSMGGQF